MANSLKTYDLLRGGNLSDEHARAMTSAVQSIETDIKLDLDSIWDRRLNELRREFRSALAEAKAELRAEIADAKAEMIRWMFIFWVGQTATTAGIIIAAFKFFK